MDTRARHSKLAALILMGLGVAFWLVFAVGETTAGEISGVQHVPPAAGLTALMVVGWRRPLGTGRALLVFAGLVAAVAVAFLIVGGLPSAPGLLLVVALPSVVTGLLLSRAGRSEEISVGPDA